MGGPSCPSGEERSIICIYGLHKIPTTTTHTHTHITLYGLSLLSVCLSADYSSVTSHQPTHAHTRLFTKKALPLSHQSCVAANMRIQQQGNQQAY